jgi:hypothetical protein
LANLSVVRMPVLTPDGMPIELAPDDWSLTPDLRSGSIKAQGGGHFVDLDLGSALAFAISEEKEVLALGKTLGRMALTGMGAALFYQGRRGGLGAGLLDLSVRGAERKSAVSGAIVWPDTSVIQVTLQGNEIDQFASVVPAEALQEDALERARQLLDLMERMKVDGRRALNEIARDVFQIDQRVKQLLSEANEGETFAIRDAARQEARKIEEDLDAKRYLCRALMAENSVSFKELGADLPEAQDATVLLCADGSRVSLTEQRQGSAQPPSPRRNKSVELLRTVGRICVTVIVIVVFVNVLGSLVSPHR